MRDGVGELVGAYTGHGMIYDDFTSSRYVRLRQIRELLSAGLLDQMLRRQDQRATSRTRRRDQPASPLTPRAPARPGKEAL